MPTTNPPAPPNQYMQIVDDEGFMTQAAQGFFQPMWQQIVAGFVNIPCMAEGTNTIFLTPTMSREGGRSYGNYMSFVFVAENTTTGAVTAQVGESLDALPVYKNNGLTPAGNGDIVAGGLYVLWYNEALNSNNGGFVLK